MIFWLYRVVFVPLATLALPFAALFHPKIREGLNLRRQRRRVPDLGGRPLWIHAASGEFEYAKAVIREHKRRFSEKPIVVTYFSPTYARNVESFPGVDFACPLPLDLPGPCAAFLKRFRPERLLIARTDFWPEILHQTRAGGIPIEIFAYTQRDPAGMSAIARYFAKWRLGFVDRVHCVSEADLDHLRALGAADKAVVGGDTRYDQVSFRLQNPKPLPTGARPATGAPVLIAGSTWPQDESALLNGLGPAMREGRLKLNLVPHEPGEEHLRKLERELLSRNLSFALFSSAAEWPDKPVLVVDKVGYLAELYAWADLAFVGGSFRGSVHSVMEALGAGLVTFVGPHHANNREAIEFQTVPVGGTRAVLATEDGTALGRAVEKHLHCDFKILKSELKAEFTRRLGASSRLIEKLADSTST